MKYDSNNDQLMSHHCLRCSVSFKHQDGCLKNIIYSLNNDLRLERVRSKQFSILWNKLAQAAKCHSKNKVVMVHVVLKLSRQCICVNAQTKIWSFKHWLSGENGHSTTCWMKYLIFLVSKIVSNLVNIVTNYFYL